MIDDLILSEQLIKKSGISDRHRTVVIGYFFEGKTYEEIGADIGVSRSRAGEILKKALRIIKKRFNPDPPITFTWLKPIPKKPKEERISKKEYYRLLALEENAWNG